MSDDPVLLRVSAVAFQDSAPQVSAKNFYTMSNYFERVRELLVDVLGVVSDEVKPNSDLRADLGADSLDVVEILMTFEEDFDIEIPDEDIENITLVSEIVSYLERVKPPQDSGE